MLVYRHKIKKFIRRIDMKKRLLILGFALMMMASATACGSQSSTEKDGGNAKTESTAASTDKKSQKFPEFKAKTVTGEDISSDVFKDNKLTVVNVWGSWCGPCVAEIPELQKLYENMKDKGVNVVGLAQDAGTDMDAVKDILDKNKVTYQNVVPEGAVTDFVMSIQAFPSTFLVDSEGNIVEKIQGGRDLESFTKAVEDALNKM